MTSLWDELVRASGRREARHIASFLECWGLSATRLGHDPSSEEMTAEWGYTAGEVSYYLKEFRRLFPGAASQALVEVRRASGAGIAGFQSLDASSLRS